jgi:hypothetical protein
LLSALGLGFVNYTPSLFPLTTVFLALAIALLGYRAKDRQTHIPFILGFLAAILVIVGKFVFVSNLTLYGGTALLVGASLWNSWPQRGIKGNSCPACVSTGAPPHLDTGTSMTSARR